MKYKTIKEHHLYDKAFRKGLRFGGKFVTVFVLRDYAAKRLMMENPQKTAYNRFGVSVGKKVGGAVERNRVKRILRAGYRAVESELKGSSVFRRNKHEQYNDFIKISYV